MSALFGGGETNPNEADAVLARYDLSGALPTFDEGVISESLLFSAGSWDHETRRTSVEEMYSRAEQDSIVELLLRLFQEEFEYEGRDIALQGQSELLVLAPQELQARVQAVLNELEGRLSSSVQLQVDVLNLPGDSPAPFGGATVIDEAMLANLPTSGRPHEQYSVRLQSGRTSIVERMRKLPLVVDYDVEIAQGSVIHDPVIGEAEAGTRILLRGAPIDGGIALSMFVAHGAPLTEDPMQIDASLRSFISTDPDQADRYIAAPHVQERYEIAFRSAAFDTVLADGKALVLTSGMNLVSAATGIDAANDRELIIIRRVSGQLDRVARFTPEGSQRELVFVNTESFQTPRAYTRGRIQPSDEHELAKLPQLFASFYTDPSEFVIDWIDDRFSTWRLVGPWAICVYDRSWDGDAADRLEALVEGWRDHARVLKVDVGGAARGTNVASWSLPVRSGANVAAMVGISTTTLYDYDTEVAQGAGAADPRLTPQFIGLAFNARPIELASGGTAVDMNLGLNLRRTPPRGVSLGGPVMTKIEKTAFDLLRLDERVVFPRSLGAAGHVLGDREGSAAVRISVQ